ncbi:general stress protein [Glaciihabitans arcticus]|uniref:General stress protein n=1 Tax=Glaciihabitans arcticus TaxID=2668039 RepID=A0A4Q9GVF1_9MICO|nr:pyridoxamine 5'-phosphate oxidase family protein [Glaciihabitans arcticus]TBN57177.1 general stress protein [Glaciihabitans arcticus]
MSESEDIDIIRTIISGSHIAVLTTVSEGGELHSRPLGVLDGEFEGSVWFFTQDPSGKTADVSTDPQVNVSYTDGKSYLSIAGTAAVEHNDTRIDQLWSPAVGAWFPDGKDDPTLALLRVDATSAQFWAIDKPAVVRFFEIAKGIVTKEQPDVGTNRAVDL